jgi:hypothetical protein
MTRSITDRKIDKDIDNMQGVIEGRCEECNVPDNKHDKKCSQYVVSWENVSMSFINKVMPSLIAHDIVGVQPMSAPEGKIFKMKTEYETKDHDPSHWTPNHD